MERVGNIKKAHDKRDVQFLKIHCQTATDTSNNNNPFADKSQFLKCTSGNKCIFRNKYVFPMNNRTHKCPQCNKPNHGPMCFDENKKCFECERLQHTSAIHPGNTYSPKVVNISGNHDFVRQPYMNRPNQWISRNSNSDTSSIHNCTSSSKKRKTPPSLVFDSSLIGLKVRKQFINPDVLPKKTLAWYNGVVVKNDCIGSLLPYLVRYEDGDSEELAADDIRSLNKNWEKWETKEDSKTKYLDTIGSPFVFKKDCCQNEKTVYTVN